MDWLWKPATWSFAYSFHYLHTSARSLGLGCDERRCALGEQYYFPLRTWFPRTLPINCDCSFCEQSSPHTCSVPSFCASSSFHGARYKTGTLNCSIEVHMSHQRSCACFMIPQLGPAHR